MSNIEPNKPCSFDNPRDFVDKLHLMMLMVSKNDKALDEKIEVIKRDMTGHLLASDGRKGIYFKEDK